MTDGYPFIFQMNDKSAKDELMEYVLQYRFKSRNRAAVDDETLFVQRITDEVRKAMIS